MRVWCRSAWPRWDSGGTEPSARQRHTLLGFYGGKRNFGNPRPRLHQGVPVVHAPALGRRAEERPGFTSAALGDGQGAVAITQFSTAPAWDVGRGRALRKVAQEVLGFAAYVEHPPPELVPVATQQL